MGAGRGWVELTNLEIRKLCWTLITSDYHSYTGDSLKTGVLLSLWVSKRRRIFNKLHNFMEKLKKKRGRQCQWGKKGLVRNCWWRLRVVFGWLFIFVPTSQNCEQKLKWSDGATAPCNNWKPFVQSAKICSSTQHIGRSLPGRLSFRKVVSSHVEHCERSHFYPHWSWHSCKK